jgi:uncharacterized cupredoxin-like copper-binding protein
MRSTRLLALAVLAAVTAACTVGGGATTPPDRSAAPSVPAAGTRVEVALTDALRMEPASITVPAGVPITFVVTNSGAIDHEFYLGDEAAQTEHAAEMTEMGGMTHDEPDGIALEPGETKELIHTFDSAGISLAGCHVAGHYSAGMKAEIAVSE